VAKSSRGKAPDWWPRDPFGHVFLARVVEKIGSALHKDWTGAEAIVIDPLPRSRKDASQSNLIDAERLLQHYRPKLKRPAVIGSNKFSEKHWKIAYGLAQRLRPALDRLRATQSEIVRKNESGELDLKIRSKNGGPWRDFQTDWWGIENWRSLFDRYCIDPDYPNGDRPSWREDNEHWIFATSESVEKLLNRLAGKSPQLTEPVKPEKYKRNTTDNPLVAEAIEGLKSKKYPNINQAALALAPRAKGSSPASTITRLRKKIAAALDD
jgi:hypothetical protein